MGGDGPAPQLGPNPADLVTAGPWLRYQNTSEGEQPVWTGSVLFLTKEGDGGGAAAAAAPTLTLIDSCRDGNKATSPDETSQLTATRLDAALGWVFWRFDLSLNLTPFQRAVQYRVEAPGADGTTYTFWLPSIGQPMHWGYYSCNGFSGDVGMDVPERADPTYMWRDLLQLHSVFPMHCLVGGGDQLYNDCVFKNKDAPLLQEWGAGNDHAKKVQAPWTPEMDMEAQRGYCLNYISTFMIKEVQQAFASIPQVMMWDDHDIFDGWGSYEADMQGCPVFQGMWKSARRFYLLFQHHTTDEFNSKAQEFLSNDGSEFHYLKYMGPQVVLLGIDMRSKRTRVQIIPKETYGLLDKAVAALPPGPQHIVVMCGCPLVFPSIPTAEAILGGVSWMVKTSPAMRKMLRKTGLLDRFDQPEILDDLVDGWAADIHKDERLEFVKLLQKMSTTKSVRITILSGDAHVGGVGRLYSRPKVKNLGDDPLYMPQIISSAIMNAPPPFGVVKMLLRTNWASNVDARTRQKMCRTFFHNHPRTDKLVAARNWCDISLVAPPFSPPTVPSDPEFGGLRFSLRVENHKHRIGHAEETYNVVVPRHPSASKVDVATGSIQEEGTPLEVPPGANGSTSHALPFHLPFHLTPKLELPAQGAAAAAAASS